MANQGNIPETPKPDNSKTSETEADKKLNRIADEAAEKLSKTERRYDETHDIFTK